LTTKSLNCIVSILLYLVNNYMVKPFKDAIEMVWEGAVKGSDSALAFRKFISNLTAIKSLNILHSTDT
jgi:hypothetical protein